MRAVLGFAFALAIAGCSAPPEIPVPAELDRTTDARLMKMIEEARSAVEREPGSASSWARLGHVYLAHTWDFEAAECYRRSIEIEPDDHRWSYYLSRSLFTIDDARAAEAFARTVEMAGDYAPARQYYGEALAALGRFDEARAQFERVAELQPRNPHTRLALGELALGGRRLEEARRELEQAIAIAPDFSEAHAVLAKACLALGDRDAANRHAELALRPSDVPPMEDPLWQWVEMMSAGPAGFFSRTNYYLAQGQVDRALAEIEKIVTGEQDDPEVWLYYASMMFDHGRNERVAAAMDRILELSNEDGRSLAPEKLVSGHILAGVAQSRLGRPEEAERHLRRALALNPDSGPALYELSVLVRSLGRLEEAQELLRRAEAAAAS